MKWKKLTGFIPVALVCLFSACEKTDSMMLPVTENSPIIHQIQQDVTRGIEVINGLLSFKNGSDFDLAVDQLDAADDKWNEEFLFEVTGLKLDDLNGMTLEDLDAIADKLERAESQRGITGDFIYEGFENELGFSSLRALLVGLEDEFLENANPDWDNDPDDHYVTGTAERTLLNKKGEIMVAGILYKFMPNGIIYEITDGDFNTLNQIDPEHAEMIFEAPNVIAHNTEVLNERRKCRTWVRKKKGEPYNNETYKYKRITGHGSMIFTNRVYSTVKHYKWKRNRWKKRRGHLKTYNWGSYGLADPGNLNASCTRQASYDSPVRARFRRRLTSRHQTMGLGFGKIESGKVHSYHEANGQVTWYTLEW